MASRNVGRFGGRAVLLAASHRFRDSVAVYAANPDDNGTLYLHHEDARAFALAILAACDSVAREAFADSSVAHFVLNAPQARERVRIVRDGAKESA